MRITQTQSHPHNNIFTHTPIHTLILTPNHTHARFIRHTATHFDIIRFVCVVSRRLISWDLGQCSPTLLLLNTSVRLVSISAMCRICVRSLLAIYTKHHLRTRNELKNGSSLSLNYSSVTIFFYNSVSHSLPKQNVSSFKTSLLLLSCWSLQICNQYRLVPS